jgi:Icc-related predicted phosphoesterase
MISKLFSREPDTRVFFATDIHGSETCWRKFLNSGKHYEAKVMVLGGDMTGKALVPIVEEGKGRWYATLLENRREFESEDEVKEFEESVMRRGSRTPRSSGTSSSTRRCWAPSSVGCGWPTRSLTGRA